MQFSEKSSEKSWVRPLGTKLCAAWQQKFGEAVEAPNVKVCVIRSISHESLNDLITR